MRKEFCGFIDPPGPFAPAKAYEAFVTELESLKARGDLVECELKVARESLACALVAEQENAVGVVRSRRESAVRARRTR